MTDKLPPLPAPLVMINRYGAGASTSDGDGGVFTAAQMHTYARAAIAAQPEPVPQTDWRKLALQFDNQRMSAMWHLQAMLQDPAGHADTVREFLAATPKPAA